DMNILRASLEAMRRAARALPVRPKLALADGRDVPPGLPCEGRALVRGDQRSQSIAASSIVAKVMRDRLMAGCGRLHVQYGFEVHMGYATVRHRTAIRVHGPVARLRRSSLARFRLGVVEMREGSTDPVSLWPRSCEATKKPPENGGFLILRQCRFSSAWPLLPQALP